ncbi:MAG TPA: isoprenylcysteine carboxylmethyltransferase family protein [Sphingobacteriaceae bacterium]
MPSFFQSAALSARETVFIPTGNFFFKYRNFLFIFLYAALLIPSPQLFTRAGFGPSYYLIPVILGLLITLTGQLVRGATIGLTYVPREGVNKNVHASELITQGLFRHCRNPLYVGNIMMLLGLGIMANSLYYLAIFIPAFLFIYQSIVLAEENFLGNKFGSQYHNYCSRVNRWFFNASDLGATFRQMKFDAKRWMFTEYNIVFIWISGVTLILLMKHPVLTSHDESLRNIILGAAMALWTAGYLYIRYLKKSKRR